MLQDLFTALLAILQMDPWLQAGAAFLTALAVAYVLVSVLLRGLSYLAAQNSYALDDEIIALLHRPLFTSILIIGLISALLLSPVDGLIETATVSLLKTVATFVWALFAIRLTNLLLTATKNKSKRSWVSLQSLPLFKNLAFFAILTIACYIAFQSWGVDMTAWLASAGVLAVAIGFAAKDTLSNFIAGVFILAESPYKMGDYIVMDSGERGIITSIGIRSTRLLTREDTELTIPNNTMGNSKIINETGGRHQKVRVRIPVGVAYGSDVALVKRVLTEVAQDCEYVCTDPEPLIRFRLFGVSSLDFTLFCWVEKPIMRGLARDWLLTAINQRFLDKEIEIPFSKHDVYIRNEPASKQKELPPPTDT